MLYTCACQRAALCHQVVLGAQYGKVLQCYGTTRDAALVPVGSLCFEEVAAYYRGGVQQVHAFSTMVRQAWQAQREKLMREGFDRR